MAVNSNSRWQVIRDIICNKKSGTLILQQGPHYLSWGIVAGKLVCVSSTLPEHSFTQFLLQNRKIDPESVMKAQLQVTEDRSIGAALLHMKVARVEGVQSLLRQHWISLCPNLLQSTNHIFWSYRETSPKLQSVSYALSLGELILHCDRSWVEIASALRCAQQIPVPYGIPDMNAVESGLCEREKRILHYLRRGSSLSEVLMDPDLDRITCYKVFFLLWVSCYLQGVRTETAAADASIRSPVLQRIRSIPPDWIVPLFAGVLVGVLLSPSADQKANPREPSAHIDNLKEAIQRPAWTVPTESAEEEVATEDTESTERKPREDTEMMEQRDPKDTERTEGMAAGETEKQ